MGLREGLRTSLDRTGIGFSGVGDLMTQFEEFGASAAVTATADGLTTGLIPRNVAFVTATASNANHVVTLPAADASMVGRSISMWIGANGCEVRTPATSGATINNVDSDGTNEAAIVATTLCVFTCVAVNTWILRAWSELAAPVTAIVPDTA